jgi:hypothetical protein
MYGEQYPHYFLNKIPHNTSKGKKSSHAKPQRSLRKYKKEIKR